MSSTKPKIAIVNSSSFGKHFKDHISKLESIADLTRVDFPTEVTEDQIISALKDVNGIIASVTPKFTKKVLENLSKLVLLARHGIGCDNVDLKTATELGILVSRVEGIVERQAVAEHAVALMMSAGRFIVPGYNSVKAGRWSDRAKYLGIELFQKKIGLIGIGNIGSRVAEILSQGFRADVMAYDPYLTAEEIKSRSARSVDFKELISTADIISFHCPLTEVSARMLNKDTFPLIKEKALLINTCRGELLDENELIKQIESERLRAYATDVVEGEPINETHRLLKLDRVLIVPHLGGYTDESLRGMGDTMVSDVESVYAKKTLPIRLANPEVLNKSYRRW